MPELINGTYVSAIVPILVIPMRTECKFLRPQGGVYSVSISGFGNGEEISTCVILPSGLRLASSSTSCLGSVRVLRNKILLILPLTLILLRLWLRLFAAVAAACQLSAIFSGVSDEVPV